MNAVEIEEAISGLAEQPFDAGEFPFAFLQAFGNKETTLKRLRKGESNRSDLGGVLQTNNIHIAVAAPGEVTKTLPALRASPAAARAKAKFVLATDGDTFEAEDLTSGGTVACAYADFPNHFGFFLPLAGITTTPQITENAFDIRATGRLNRLYVELLKDNPEWGTAARRHDMNHFMARLIFCFFAEDTGIFNSTGLFTATIEQMSARNSSNTHEVIGALFRAMNTPIKDRAAANLRPWADVFPYVNGGLFSGSLDAPRFTRIARSYLLHIGGLDWRKINPDIFGSMIQAVAEGEERGALGLHYTSVPNMLKVRSGRRTDTQPVQPQGIAAGDPILGAERQELGEGQLLAAIQHVALILGDDKRQARDLGREVAQFDAPEVGQGNVAAPVRLAAPLVDPVLDRPNLLVGNDQEIARAAGRIEHPDPRHAPAQVQQHAGVVARLFQPRSQVVEEEVKHHADDLFHTPLDQAQIDFENEGGETYICGNPPYRGSQWQTEEQKSDLKVIFDRRTKNWKSLDYVSGWFMKAVDYGTKTRTVAAFVATNSICQGRQVDTLWSLVFLAGTRSPSAIPLSNGPTLPTITPV